MKNHLLNYPTVDELRALDLRARHERARAIARLFRTGALATVSLLDRLAGVPAEKDADTRKEFDTPFWRAASKSQPPAWRRRYLPQMKSAERLDLALDALAQVWKSLAELLHFSPRHPAL